MKHLHYTSLESTQDEIIRHLATALDDDYFLVSAKEQTKGRGRHGRSWDNFKDGIYMSLMLPPANTLTLTTLEISVLISEFFNSELQVKWPNDIYTYDQKKCAGILIDVKEGKLIAGIGINLNSKNDKYGSIFYQENNSQEELSFKIANHIKNHRLSDSDIINRWNKLCFHLNKKVEIIDLDQSFLGIFEGIGRNGQALLNIEGKVKEFYSGSLKLIS